MSLDFYKKAMLNLLPFFQMDSVSFTEQPTIFNQVDTTSLRLFQDKKAEIRDKEYGFIKAINMEDYYVY